MLIVNGIIVNEDGQKKCDVRLRGEKIVEIGENLSRDEEEIIDAGGAYLLPGGIDVHTHFDMPAGACMTSDDFTSGTKAAVLGGTTAVIDFAEYDSGETLRDGLARWHKKADGRSYCDYGFHMTVSEWNESMAEQIEEMKRQGIYSFKAYTAYKDGIGVEDSELFRILQQMRKSGTLLCVHCENGDVLECLQEQLKKENPADIRNHPHSRPNLVEKEAVSKVIDFAQLAGASVYIVHVSTKEAVEVIREAKRKGQKVFAETCPQYLFLNEKKYELPGFESARYVLSPPLRSEEDVRALWEALVDGTIDVISTDHCSFRMEDQKELGRDDFTKIPNGMPGVETRMELMLSYGRQAGLSLEKLVSLTSAKPAEIFGLYPKKGRVQEGSDADLLILEEAPHIISRNTLHQEVDYTPYEGMEVTYKIRDVFVKGARTIAEGRWMGEKKNGSYLRRI